MKPRSVFLNFEQFSFDRRIDAGVRLTGALTPV
jgi:hypothetical protein